MDKTILFQKQVIDEWGQSLVLQYAIVTRTILNECDNEEKIYGAEISKWKDGTLLEQEGAYCLSICKTEIENWLGMLARGNAMPVSLLSLADDFISSIEMAV